MHELARLADLSPPPWALGTVIEGAETEVSDGRYPIRVLEGDRFALLSTSIQAATDMTAGELEERVEESYLGLLGCAGGLRARHLVRVWNLIPGILEPLGRLEHRYLAFNAGRFRAYRGWFGERLPERIPTASGVGAPGSDLAIHGLTTVEECRPLQNPRQRPSHRYSDTYGPCPPCFARAALLSTPGGVRWLVAGGTASVRGEKTVYPGDLERQAEETFLNLATLIDVGQGRPAGRARYEVDDLVDRLSRFRSLRVYFVDEESRVEVSSRIESRFRRLETVEYVRTELCRDDLLIEIEGLAELD